MFVRVRKLECLKTPVGFKTNLSEINYNFRMLKLKKGDPAKIEKDNINLNAKYTINGDNDDQAMYHVYREDKCAGVTFNNNGGDTQAWYSHETAERGKSLFASEAALPVENPKREGYKFLGWATTEDATTPDFTENTVVNYDINVYAVWKNAVSAVTFYETFDETKVLKQITVAQGMKIGDKLPEDPVRDGFEFKHWTTSKDDPENPANKVTKNTVINADTKVYAVWDGDEPHKVVLDCNGGVLAGGFEEIGRAHV